MCSSIRFRPPFDKFENLLTVLASDSFASYRSAFPICFYCFIAEIAQPVMKHVGMYLCQFGFFSFRQYSHCSFGNYLHENRISFLSCAETALPERFAILKIPEAVTICLLASRCDSPLLRVCIYSENISSSSNF